MSDDLCAAAAPPEEADPPGRRQPVARLGLGTVLDELAAAGSQTLVHLSRPLDIAPDGGTCWTVPGLADLVRRCAARIAAAGAGPGDRVAVVKRNHWDYVLLACAAARIGAVPVLLSGQLPPAALATLLERVRPALLLADPAVLAAARAAGADLTRHAARTARLPGPRTASGAGARDRGTDHARAFAELPDAPVPSPHTRPDDAPLAVMHTSGTTGVPKLVVHSTTTLVRRLSAFEARRWPLVTPRPRDTVASAISFCHGRALTWTMSALWHQPRALVLLADAGAGVEARPGGEAGPGAEAAGCGTTAALDLLAAHRPTVVEALPATYEQWAPHAARGDLPFADVRLFISTFDAMHPPAVRSLLGASRRRVPLWMQGWGQSETGPLTFRFFTRRALAAPAGRHPTTRNLGRPVPGRVALRVVDPVTLRRRPRGRPGLVLARTSARCTGYLGEDERLADKVRGRWFNTGDLGALTRTGALRLLDREVDTAPGLSCVEIEDVLHDRLAGAVHEAVVLGLAGRLPQPVLVAAGDAVPPVRWAGAVADLPPMAPPLFVAADRVPRTGTGKVRRHALREQVLAGAAGHGTGRWT